MVKETKTKEFIVSEDSFASLVDDKAIFIEQAKQNKTIDKGLKGYQSIALAVMIHVAKHGDIRVLRKFFEDMPEGLRIKAMKVYFEKYATVTFDDEGEVHYNKEVKLQLALAMENAWWKAAPPERMVPFNFDAELIRIVEKAKKRLEKNVEGDTIDKETVEAVRLLATRKNVQVKAVAA